MSHVLGAAIKAAMPTVVAKQVAAGGATVMSAQVVFQGKEAYAAWEQKTAWAWEIDPVSGVHGRVLKQHRAFKIGYPGLPDEALLTRSEADLIAAYTLHETGHVLYTNNREDGSGNDAYNLCSKANLSRELVHPLANGIEDGRMEASVIDAGVARNSRQLFRRLLNKLTAECLLSNTYNPCRWADAAFTLAMLSREALGNGNPFTAALLDRIPEPKRTLYVWVMDECRKAPRGFDSDLWAYKLAIEFVRKWGAIAEEQKQNEPDDDPPEPKGVHGDFPCPAGKGKGTDDDADKPHGNPGDGGRGKKGSNADDDEEHGFGKLDGDEDTQADDDDDFDDKDDGPSRVEDEGEGDESTGGTVGWPEDGDDDGKPGKAGEGGDDDPEDGDEGGAGKSEDDAADDGDDDDGGDGDGGNTSGGAETGDDVSAGGDEAGAGDQPHRFDDFVELPDATPRSAEPEVDALFKRINKRTGLSSKSAMRPIIPAEVLDGSEYLNACADRLVDQPYLTPAELADEE